MHISHFVRGIGIVTAFNVSVSCSGWNWISDVSVQLAGYIQETVFSVIM